MYFVSGHPVKQTGDSCILSAKESPRLIEISNIQIVLKIRRASDPNNLDFKVTIFFNIQ